MEKYENLKKLIGCIKFNRGEAVERMFEDILEYIRDVEEERDAAVNRLNAWNKDTEIKRLQSEIDKYRQLSDFVITEEENKSIIDWMNKHNKEKHRCNREVTSIYSSYEIVFTPTSIGTAGEVRCSCGDGFIFREIR